MEQKRLYRSRKNRIFAGVCGGLGEYFNIDPVIIRLFWVFVLIFTGIVPGTLMYIIAFIIMPLSPDHSKNSHNHDHNSTHAHHAYDSAHTHNS